MGGRIDDITVVESIPSTYYVGYATGGIFKTENNGTTFTQIFDVYPTASIGDIAVAPSDPTIVYVGTGEPNNRQSSSYGDGVYKSTDAGKTFVNVGLKETQTISRVIVHPTNPNVVYVAAVGHLFGPNKERGLYKAIDGGKTWTNTKFIDEDKGFIDAVMDPSKPDTLYAASYQRRRSIVFWQIREPQDSTTKAVEARPGLLASLGKIFQEKEKRALWLLLAIFAWFVGYNAVSKFFTLYGVMALKMDASQASFLLTFLALMFVLFAVPSGYIAAKFGRRKTILTGIALVGVLAVIVGFLPIGLQTSGLLLPLMLALIGIGWALNNINSLPMVVDIAPQTELATYTGLYYFFSTMAAIIGPWLGGALVDFTGRNYAMIFTVAPIGMLVAFLLMLGVRRGERADQVVVPSRAT